METVLQIIKNAGGWNHGLSLRIDNPPYMPLVIEALDESGPRGLPAISVAHYGEQNGDAMRDPEMLFELSIAESDDLTASSLSPFYYRNDYVAIEQWSRGITNGIYTVHHELHRRHEAFAKLWDKNLRDQGFAQAFERQRTHA